MKFEEIKTNLTKSEKIKLQCKGLCRDLFKALVVLILALVVARHVYINLDVLVFSTLFPNEVRNAIVVHNQGEKVKQAFIDELYSRSIK